MLHAADLCSALRPQAIHLMNSAVETAQLEQDIMANAPDQQEAAETAAKQFERSSHMRLWRASGLAACAVYKAMILGRKLGKQYVDAAQVQQAQGDIVARLRESDVVKAKLEDRLVQLDEADARARANLDRAIAARDDHTKTKAELIAQLEDPRLNEEPGLRERIPQVEGRRRTAAASVKRLDEEWNRVDAEAKKKYETVDKVPTPMACAYQA
jgi:hypothetical protein